MALRLNENSGFVTVAPVVDPDGSNFQIDTDQFAVKDTSPENINKITEVGFYVNTATEEANFEIGIYTGADEPTTLIHVERVNAKGLGTGWISVSSLDWEMSPDTVYWIAVQLDDTATNTFSDAASSGGSGYAASSATTLTEPFAATTEDADGMYAVYALYSEKPGIMVTSEEIDIYSGENVNATGSTQANKELLTSKAQGFLSNFVKYDLVTNWELLNEKYREMFSEWVARTVANDLIKYNMDAYTSRVEAEDMININIYRIEKIEGILNDASVQDFMEV